MEVAIDPAVPTYSGGLGVLAGDVARTAADLKVPMVVVTLLHRKGYFTQRIDSEGRQQEEPVEWDPRSYLQEMKQRASVELEGRTVYLRSWRYEVVGIGGFKVPVYFLDTDLPENSEADRTLTHHLYGGDITYRLCQEAIFGIGGIRMLRVLGYEGLTHFHMNEGHASLLTLALLDGQARKAGKSTFTQEEVEAVRSKCVFTTHTPVSAGHDRFPMDLVDRVLGRQEIGIMQDLFCWEGELDLTHIASSFSHYVSGVSERHRDVCRSMFKRPVESVTNGVHVPTWTAPSIQALYDRHIPDWKEDNFDLRYALLIPQGELWAAHIAAKTALLDEVKTLTGIAMDKEVFTIGFARRATAYKRLDLIFEDLKRLKRIVSSERPLQVILGGKAHPHDQGGKETIHRLVQAGRALGAEIKVAFLENYGMALGKLMTSGVDLWLSTPQPPLEASGTSGMKAALNGVPSLSVLDGWWVEGHLEGVTGWAIGPDASPALEERDRRKEDAASLYQKLEAVILPLYYQKREEYINIMRQTIALNGSYFNTQRMMQQYILNAYFQ